MHWDAGMDDAELVTRLKRYEDQAVSFVVTQYGTALHRYITALVGDPHQAEDIVSETYVRMLERIGEYTYTGAPFRAWLYRIAHNLAINTVTRTRTTANEAVLAQREAPDGDPAIDLERREEHAAVRDALTQLTEEQQQVLLLRFVAEQPIAEVARQLQRSEGSIKQLQLRALRSLGRVLGWMGGRDG
jgi:RNA polymerase sigma-70 factor (ECF subfamily)